MTFVQMNQRSNCDLILKKKKLIFGVLFRNKRKSQVLKFGKKMQECILKHRQSDLGSKQKLNCVWRRRG